jgi:hypothetical protein
MIAACRFPADRECALGMSGTRGKEAMKRHVLIGSSILLGLTATAALAQNSLGDLLDGGAKKLSKDAVKSALGGAHVSGKSVTGADTEYDYKVDGYFSGNLQAADGFRTGAVGTWTVDESGKLCSEWTLTTNSKRFSGCGFLYAKGDQLYYVESDSDKGAKIYKRVIKK